MNYDTTIYKKSKIKNKEKLNLGQVMLTIAILLLMFAVLTNPAYYAQSVTKGLLLFTTAVLPGLLPFMFFTKVIINLNLDKVTTFLNAPAKKLFGLNGHAFYGFFASCISGYPVGAKLTSELYLQNKISERHLLKTSLLCSTSGPIFIIGTVGVLMLNNFNLGVILYLINIFSTFLSVLILSMFEKIKGTNNKHEYSFSPTDISNINQSKNTLNIISHAASDTATSLLTVAFYIAFFYMMIDLLANIKILQVLANFINILLHNKSLSLGTVSGMIEMTKGIQILSSSNTVISLSIIAFLLSFSGFSIIFQSLSFLNNTPLKNHKFIFGKLLQGFIAFITSLIAFTLIL